MSGITNLSNDLAILSMDLSDAASLCQEGKHLIQLEKKIMNITLSLEGYQDQSWNFLPFSDKF